MIFALCAFEVVSLIDCGLHVVFVVACHESVRMRERERGGLELGFDFRRFVHLL